mmetsp:Transcript_5581/g.12938  ORF Transcript_5581/g.12938 Transcript_5581/m.12938 type:complete len:209 (-) Transcript_5581:2983-3609(-)
MLLSKLLSKLLSILVSFSACSSCPGGGKYLPNTLMTGPGLASGKRSRPLTVVPLETYTSDIHTRTSSWTQGALVACASFSVGNEAEEPVCGVVRVCILVSEEERLSVQWIARKEAILKYKKRQRNPKGKTEPEAKAVQAHIFLSCLMGRGVQFVPFLPFLMLSVASCSSPSSSPSPSPSPPRFRLSVQNRTRPLSRWKWTQFGGGGDL